MPHHSVAPMVPRFPEDWPRLGLGLAPLGDIRDELPEARAAETLNAAWDAGIRLFDTAPWYGHGLSEHRLGALLRQHPRGVALVSTKVGRVYAPARRGEDARVQWAGGLNFGLRFDYSAEGFKASLAQSKLRMGTAAVEALVIHDLDAAYHGVDYDRHMGDLTGSGLAWLHRLKAEGEIAAVGMGINALADFERVADWIALDFFLVAMPYTLLDQAALHGPMARCLERGIKVVVGSPFASGVLTNPSDPSLTYAYEPVPDPVRARALAIEAACREHGVSVRAAALQFPLLHPAVVSVIPGAVTPEQVQENARNVEVAIPGELWATLKSRGLIDEAAPVGD